MLEPKDTALDDVAAPVPLDAIDALAMDQFWRLLLVVHSGVMTEVVHHVEGVKPSRGHKPPHE